MRFPGDYWTVPRAWPGETVAILGGGPSLREVDLNLLRGFKVIAINNAWELLPSADVVYFCDSKWWRQMRPKTMDFASNGAAVCCNFRGSYIVTIADGMSRPPLEHQVHTLRNAGRYIGLAQSPDSLGHGSNSGYQAINLAFHFGVRRILLFGYDMRVDGKQTHWHAGHGRDPEFVQHQVSQVFAPAFEGLVKPLATAGVEVLNCTPESALTYWPKRTLMEVLYFDGRLTYANT